MNHDFSDAETPYSGIGSELPTGSAAGGDLPGNVKVRVENLVKWYSEILAVDEISFEVHEGEFFVLIGPSGCGKTTTLQSILGTVEPTSGRIYIDDEDITNQPTHERDIGMVFQHFMLFPHLTVEENVEFGLKRIDVPGPERDERVSEVLELIDQTAIRGSYPQDLSQGQKQAVALARTIVLEPSVLLLDEPLGDLDFRTQKKMEIQLKLIQDELNLTMVYVTHDQTQAMRLADRLLVMNEGRIEQIGQPADVYHHPDTAFVGSFLGDANIFVGELADVDSTAEIVKVKFEGVGVFEVSVSEDDLPQVKNRTGEETSFMVRPENVSLCASTDELANTIHGEVVTVPTIGQDAFVDVGSMEIQLRLDTDQTVSTGDPVIIGWTPGDATLLNQASVVEGVDLQRDVLGQ